MKVKKSVLKQYTGVGWSRGSVDAAGKGVPERVNEIVEHQAGSRPRRRHGRGHVGTTTTGDVSRRHHKVAEVRIGRQQAVGPAGGLAERGNPALVRRRVAAGR